MKSIKRKYEFTDETMELYGTTFRRIKALIDFSDVMAGDLGGWVEKEDNLSHGGNAWVYSGAQVYGNARVFGNALVFDNAQVYDDAWVYGDAQVYDNARAYGNALVYGDTRVFGNAEIR